MPKDLTWIKIVSTGEPPNARLGHTMVQMDKNMFVMFGGLDNEKKEGGKIMPNNDVFLLKFNNQNEAVWKKVQCEGMEIPLARSNHASCKLGQNMDMFVFGGLFSSSQRFNDVHILKCAPGGKFRFQ